jgi:hypothetical protein
MHGRLYCHFLLLAAASTSAAYGVDGVVLWSPATELYPRYIADPHRSGFAFTYGQFIDPEIAQAGDTRLTIRLGGSYGILRFIGRVSGPWIPGRYQGELPRAVRS